MSVADLDCALPLYRDALGLVEQYRQGDLVMLVVAGGAGPQVLLHRRVPEPSMAGVAASLQIDDVDRATEAALAGADVERRPR